MEKEKHLNTCKPEDPKNVAIPFLPLEKGIFHFILPCINRSNYIVQFIISNLSKAEEHNAYVYNMLISSCERKCTYDSN